MTNGAMPTGRSHSWSTGIFAAIAFGLGTRAASAQCRIEVKQARLKGVVVTVPGVTFSLDLDRVPLTVEPERGKANASLQVMAPLRFSASYPTDKLSFQIKGRIDLYGGRVRLGKAAAHDWLGVRGDAMQLSPLSTLGIEMKEPLQIPCSHIGLGDGTPYWPPEVVWPRKDRTTGVGPAFFPLYLGPQEADPLPIRYPGPFRILGRRQGWVRIEAAWHDGSKVTGWTPERNMTEKVVPVGGWRGASLMTADATVSLTGLCRRSSRCGKEPLSLLRRRDLSGLGSLGRSPWMPCTPIAPMAGSGSLGFQALSATLVQPTKSGCTPATSLRPRPPRANPIDEIAGSVLRRDLEPTSTPLPRSRPDGAVSADGAQPRRGESQRRLAISCAS